MRNNSELAEDLDIIGASAWLDAIQDVVVALPGDVAEWVVENLTFIDVSSLTGLAVKVNCRPSEQRNGNTAFPCRLVIVLGDAEDESRRTFTVAHEIAHHWLGHDLGNYEQQEQEADAQANTWGFAGQSHRI